MVRPEELKRDATKTIGFPFDGPLKVLTLRLIYKIDDLMARVGPSGEVRLIKNNGRLRFIQRVEVVDAIQPLADRDGGAPLE